VTEYTQKLIEVALPLEAINRESAHEKSVPRRGHPATLHLWWARRPLAACRAVLFASLVDDPSAHPEAFPTAVEQETERQRLFRIIEDLVKWENSTDETVLNAARAEIMRSTDGNPPPVLDPFCGGGSIPLEAQRLGLEAHASDLNPVAVLVTKALVEIPPKFAGLPPVNPEATAKLDAAGWHGAEGLAEDVRVYGRWVREEAMRRIGHMYPKVTVPRERGGGQATVIAWLWARTVHCPNPACGAEMPLVRTFALSTKEGKRAWIEPKVDAAAKTVRFEVRSGTGSMPEAPKVGRGAKFRCLVCGNIAEDQHVRDEALAGRMGAKLMAVVGEGERGRVYVSPTDDQVRAAEDVPPAKNAPRQSLANDPRNIWCVNYGLDTIDKLFTPRQLVALTTFSDLMAETRERVASDAAAAWPHLPLRPATEATASGYADAVVTYLSFAIDKLSDWSSTTCSWIHSIQGVRDTFARQAIPMVWDYVEINPLSDSVGNFANHVEWVADGIAGLVTGTQGEVSQLDAVVATTCSRGALVSTDPPYYDNISYANLSDFFYVWLRRSLSAVYPQLFSTLVTPKVQELVASPQRFDGSKKKAQAFFEEGLGAAFEQMKACAAANFPITVYYAFKQAENKSGDAAHSVASTGWETMLTGLMDAGLTITGTWPMRSERAARNIAHGTNALASSVVLVCRPRSHAASPTTRKEFLASLRAELPRALKTLQRGSIAPVDLAQASIGPGMAVFSRHSKVLEADGSRMTVRTALALINESLDEILAEQEGEFEPDTRWAIAWFEQFGTDQGDYGVADVLARAKNTSVAGLAEAGIVQSKSGKVRLLRRDELSVDWDPAADERLTVWELTQHLLRRLDGGGEAATAALARQLGSLAEVARDLAYRLYLVCERKKWAQEALAYNALVVAWPEIQRLAAAAPPIGGPSQTRFEV